MGPHPAKMLHVENEIGEGFEYTGCDLSNLYVQLRKTI